jgi:hypothetical protein
MNVPFTLPTNNLLKKSSLGVLINRFVTVAPAQTLRRGWGGGQEEEEEASVREVVRSDTRGAGLSGTRRIWIFSCRMTSSVLAKMSSMMPRMSLGSSAQFSLVWFSLDWSSLV